MIKKTFVLSVVIFALLVSQVKGDISGSLDLEKFCRAVYDLYQTDEVPAKKELFVYKKLNELIGTTQTMKITASDSIVYDRKTDMSTVKSREIFYSDNMQGYFGVFVIATKKGDDLLMSCTPEKEFSVTGKITDVVVLEYIKNNLNAKCFTSLKDFDDKGTVIQKVTLKVEM
jgi:hypothetical protein